MINHLTKEGKMKVKEKLLEKREKYQRLVDSIFYAHRDLALKELEKINKELANL